MQYKETRFDAVPEGAAFRSKTSDRVYRKNRHAGRTPSGHAYNAIGVYDSKRARFECEMVLYPLDSFNQAMPDCSALEEAEAAARRAAAQCERERQQRYQPAPGTSPSIIGGPKRWEDL
jgi:hypothetical protein